MHLQSLPPLKDGGRLLKRLARWYPRDCFFAFLLATFRARRGQYLRAAFSLYRVFRNPEPVAIYSGKWIEIRSHLLLARIYEAMGWHKSADWKTHWKVEYEYELCAMLADMKEPDIGADDYKVVASSRGEGNAKEAIRHYLKELGYAASVELPIDSRALRAIVHHSYSSCLLQQIHREHDAIRHEEIVTELVPDYGESLLNCAIACRKTGNTARAMKFLHRAQDATPQDWHPIIFQFMVAREEWNCHADCGDSDEARKWFGRCVELNEYDPLSTDEKLKAELRAIANDTSSWAHVAMLARTREKHFSETLTYKIPSLGIQCVLPPDWKIDHEGVTGDGGIEAFAVIFSSQANWDKEMKQAADASADILYACRTEDLARTGEAFGLYWLHVMNQSRRRKMRWSATPSTRNLGKATERRWAFEINEPWPKKGILVTYELDNSRIKFGVMCQKCGETTWWPMLTSLVEEFGRQECMTG
jgi:tetratricopeptide (TPR) repeat protein